MHTNNSFIQGQENMKFLVKANSNKEYNDYLFKRVSSSLFLKTSWKHPC